MNYLSLCKQLKILIPISFVLGAGVEWFMIQVRFQGKNFYDVAKEKKAERIIAEWKNHECLEKDRDNRRKRLKEKYGKDCL